MKSLSLLLFFLTFTPLAHAQWVDVWQASPNVWEEPTNPKNLNIADFEILKTSGLNQHAKMRILDICLKKFSDSKGFYVGDTYGNNYQVNEVSQNGEVNGACTGKVAETLCKQQFAKAKINDCIEERL